MSSAVSQRDTLDLYRERFPLGMPMDAHRTALNRGTFPAVLAAMEEALKTGEPIRDWSPFVWPSCPSSAADETAE